MTFMYNYPRVSIITMEKVRLMKKGIFNRLSCVSKTFLSLCALAVFASCGDNAGLGSSVDTEAPKLSIEYPSAAATIKGEFIFYGTCSDDKAVTKVQVTVENLDTKMKYGPFYADIKDSLTWQVKLNAYDSTNAAYTNGWQLPDGKYQLSVIAYDNAGHSSGENSRQFDIDNTAPVFVITKPGVIRSSYGSTGSLSKYGSLFTVEGTIADDHSIEKMDILVYDENGELLNNEPYTEEEISTTGGTSVTIARYISEDDESTANTRYNEIYNYGTADATGNKVYSCTITIADSAKTYLVPGDGGVAGGNETSVVYLYDDIYDDYMSTKKGAGLTANDFRAILNGSAADSDISGKGVTSPTVEEVRVALKELARDTSSASNNSLSFSLNPNADPTYSISSFQIAYNDDGTEILASANKAMGEQPLTVVASAGLDQVNIIPSSIKVWIKKIGGSDTELLTKAGLATDIDALVSAVKALEAEQEETESFDTSAFDEVRGWTLICNNADNTDPSDTTVTVSTQIPGENFIEADAYYSVIVTGKDKDDVAFSQGTLYGFIGSISAVPPSVSFTAPASLAYFANSKAETLVFEGTAVENNSGMTLKALSATLTVTNENTGDTVGNPITVTITGSSNHSWTLADGLSCTYDTDTKTNKWIFTPASCAGYASVAAEEAALAYMYTVAVEAKGSAGLATTETRSVHIDTTAPEVTISSITPTVSGSDYFGNEDTHTYINGSVSIKGSINEQNLEEVTYDVWASTDLEKELTSDDSILAELQEYLKENETTIDLDGSLGKIYSINKEFPSSLVTAFFRDVKEAGDDARIQAEVIVTAVDTVGNKGTYSSKDSNDGKNFIIYQETDRPKITLGNADESVTSASGINIETNLFGTTTNNKLSLSFTDDDSIVEYEICLYKEDSTQESGFALLADSDVNEAYGANPYKVLSGKTSASINYLLPETEGVYFVKVLARDYAVTELSDDSTNPYGNCVVGNFAIAVDSGAPSLNITTATGYKKNGFAIEGIVSPSSKGFDNGTTVSAVFIDADGKVLETQPATVTYANSGTAFKATITFDSPVSESYTILFTLTDKYEQQNATKFAFMMDGNAPVISNATADASVFLDESTYFTINAEVTDDYSGVATFGYIVSTSGSVPTDYDAVTWTQMNQGEKNWNATVSIKEFAETNNCADGTVHIYYGAKDNAGNTAIYSEKTTLTLDATKPVVTIKAAKDDSVVADKATLTTTDTATTVYVEVVDTNIDTLVSNNQYVVVGEGETVTDESGAETGKKYAVTVNWQQETEAGLEEEQTVIFTATDKNNRSAESTATISCDTITPRVAISSDVSGYVSSAFVLSGTVTDANFTTTNEYLKVFLIPETGTTVKTGAVIITAGSTAETDGLHTWDASFTGLEEDKYNIVIIAKDTFGNGIAYSTNSTAVPETASYTGNDKNAPSSLGTMRIVVDTAAPTLDETSVKVGTAAANAQAIDSTYYTNGKAAIYITAHIEEKGSGINSVYVRPYEKVSSDALATAETIADAHIQTITPSALTDSEGNETGIFSFAVSIPVDLVTKTGNIYARFVDKAGNITDVSLVSITYDPTNPVIQSYVLSDSYKKTTDNTTVYYVNNKKQVFTLSGIATDNLGIASVTLSVTETSGSHVISRTETEKVSEWAFASLDMKEWSSGATAVLTVTDKAGNTAAANISLVFDTQAPRGIHLSDSKNKDIYFRVGTNDNDDIDSNSTNPKWDNDLDKNVGGKYSAGTYGNASTITIRGNFTDDSGSGVKMIYYKVYTEELATDKTSDVIITEVMSSPTGYFAPLATVEKKRVFYTDTTNTNGTLGGFIAPDSQDVINGKYYVTVESTFDTVLSGFTEGSNYLVLVAEDNVGNTALDSVTVAETDENGSETEVLHRSASINVDTQVPTIISNATAIQYTNAESNRSFSGTATDADAGVRTIVVTINDKKITTTESAYGKITITSANDSSDKNKKNWELTINSAAVFDASDTMGNFTVYAEVTDNAGSGNSQIVSIGTLALDKILPTVTLTAPTDADSSEKAAGTQVNGVISLSGTVSDSNVLPNDSVIGIEYATPTENNTVDNDTWTSIPTDSTTYEITGNYSFTVKGFDTTALPDDSYYLRAVAKDIAGNKGYSEPVSVIVAQDSDRPVVQITNLANVAKDNESPSYILKFGTNAQISGTIKDDDATATAVVDTFIVSDSPFTVADDGTVSGKTGDFTEYKPTSGEWTFEPETTTDGSHKIYFYVKDNTGKVFYTGNATYITESSTSTALARPYFQFKTDNKTDNDGCVVYRSDSDSPTIVSVKAKVYKDAGGTEEDTLYDAAGEEISDGVNLSSIVFGGTTRRYVRFILKAYDANGIDRMQFVLTGIDSTDNTLEKKVTLSTDETTDEESWSSKYGILGTTEASPAPWTTNVVDVSQFATGSISCTAYAYDPSDLMGNTTPSFSVDQTGPTITISNPKSTEEVTGTITLNGSAIDNGGSSTASTKWLIPNETQRTSDDITLIESATWLDTGFADDASASQYKFLIAADVISVYDTDTYSTAISDDGIYTLPVYILSVDELGNAAIGKHSILHNPEGDRPRTTISYPDSTGTATGGVILGGTIRVTGSSEIPIGEASVSAVYLQIGSVADDGTVTWNSSKVSSAVSKNASGVNEGGYGYAVYDKDSAQTNLGFDSALTFTSDSAATEWWGVKANKTTSWNLSINTSGEMDPASGSVNKIAIRACAINSNRKVGAWSQIYYINVDATAPTQKATLRQYSTEISSSNDADSSTASSTASALRVYEDGMYLKDDWYLTVQLYDESKLESYTVKKGSTQLTAGADYFASTITTGDDGNSKTQYLFIPVDKSSDSVSYTVTVTDTTDSGGHTVTATYNLNIDNDAPTINKIYNGSDSETSESLSNDFSVVDSNYKFILGGKVSEPGSGFERAVFYYIREGNSYKRQAVLDPLITTGIEDSKAYLYGSKTENEVEGDDTSRAILTERTFSQDTKTCTLWALAVTGKMETDGYTFTADSSLSDNNHIRVGGLIEVGGVLRKIDSIDGTTVTFDTSTGVTEQTATTAYFPYAQVVDNTGTENSSSDSANPFTFTSGDDGDLMPESVSGSKSTGFTWDASIHSTNMPDGPAKLVVLVFDKAGNVSGAEYSVKIENNAPRLAKVWLGTDLNSSNTWTENEFVGYNLYEANNSYGIATTEVKAEQEIATANYGSSFIIKNELAVVAELVGGNGDIMMVYGKDASDTTPVTSSSGTAGTKNSSITSLVEDGKLGKVTYNKIDNTATALYGYTLANTALVASVAETNDGTGKGGSFTFWDSTEETTPGSTSQKCVLYVNDFTIDLVDSVPPKVVVNPFYWASADENSLYDNKSANGHIELEADWKNAIGYSSSATSGEYDADPKVSGKITFTGTAYDDHALKSLAFTFADFGDITMATYDPTSTNATYVANGGWSALSGNSGKSLAEGGKYEWEIKVDATGSKETAGHYDDTYYLAQNGHKVYWTVSVNTAEIGNVAALNQTFTVKATDSNSNSSASSTPRAPDTTGGAYTVADGTTHKPSYQMDVVPYITGIETSVRSASGLKSNNIRSASGKYSILANNIENVITVTGFNFSTSDFVAKIANATASGGTTITKTNGGTGLTASANDANTATITNSGITKSGYLEIFSNGVRALNNINDNNAHDKDGSGSAIGSAIADWANYYNREPDYYTTKNVQLTDDRYIRFFDMKDTGVKNGYYPNMIVNKLNSATGADNVVFGIVNPSGATSGYDGSSHSTDYKPQRYVFNEDGEQQSVEVLIGGSTWDQMAMTQDDSGRYHHMTVFNRAGCDMSYIYDRFSDLSMTAKYSGQTTRVMTGRGWGSGIGYNSYIVNTSQTTKNNALTLEDIDYKSSLVDRYQNLKVVAKGNSTSTSGSVIFLAYYDDGITDNYGNILPTLCFRNFKISTNSSLGNQLYRASDHTGATVYRASDNGTYSQYTNMTENTGNSATYHTGRNEIASNASQYFDMVAIPDGTNSYRVVIIYYDGSKLHLLYSTSALDGSNPDSTSISFTENESINLPDYVGQYVSMCVDSSGHIHIAAFDAGDSDLVYIYMTSYNATSYDAMTVDQYASVGNWTNINIDTTTGHKYYNKPIIAYTNATETGGRDAIKLAIANETVGENVAGVDGNNYTTGKWEYMTVPAITPPQSGSSKFRQVCLDFDSSGNPVVGYLGTNLEFGKWLTEEE